ncbi:hypothetical protein D5045_00720 [Verminephrobacter eiseniae]|nr:hypothetical protein [Verminephrobacter eiseniae]
MSKMVCALTTAAMRRWGPLNSRGKYKHGASSGQRRVPGSKTACDMVRAMRGRPQEIAGDRRMAPASAGTAPGQRNRPGDRPGADATSHSARCVVGGGDAVE